jgi:parallel beta-helix repeat protein
MRSLRVPTRRRGAVAGSSIAVDSGDFERDGAIMRTTANIARVLGVTAALGVALIGVMVPLLASAATCGGLTPCACGDTVTTSYTMTSDLGPCPRVADPDADTVGLFLKSGVTLDCQGHAITGPGDQLKNAFGIRAGDSGSALVSDVLIANCDVSRFWWGVSLQNVGTVVIDSNRLSENGWKDPTQNGTGYGLNIANSDHVTVRNNVIADNGNEGLHLSASTAVTIETNMLSNNGFEQLYLIHADGNVIRGNLTEGGTQGLEMRWSNNNAFSYNRWTQSPAQVLENDNHDNTFFYDHFEGTVVVAGDSAGNLFQLSEFTDPTGTCLRIDSAGETYVLKGYFRSCAADLASNVPATLDRSMNNLLTIPKIVVVKLPGCTADVDLDADVGASDRQVVLAAMNSVIGDANWAPEADLDHDGAVAASDLAILDNQFGPCTANLVVTAISDPPASMVPGTRFSVTDTVENLSAFAGGTSRTQYYLSADTVKSTTDKLLGGRSVPALVPHGASTGTVALTIPTTTPSGIYFLVACADDKGDVPESDEADNCRASASFQVGRPDLVIAAVSDPPSATAPGTKFSVTDTVRNQSSLFPAGSSHTRYYLSLDPSKSAGDKLLAGSRAIPSLAPGGASTGAVLVTIPLTMSAGTYYVLSCADDTKAVSESDETNNCRASAAQVQVGKPDLVTTAISDPPATASRGTHLSVVDTVKNQGTVPAESSRVQYYLSLDSQKNTGDKLLTGSRTVPSLAAGDVSTGTASVTIPTNTVFGSYFLMACADAKSAVAESDETNNCRASSTTISITP